MKQEKIRSIQTNKIDKPIVALPYKNRSNSKLAIDKFIYI